MNILVRVVGLFLLFCGFGLSQLHCASAPAVSGFELTQERKLLFVVDTDGGEFCGSLGVCLRFPKGAVAAKTEVFGWRGETPNGGTVPNLHLEASVAGFARDIEIEIPVATGQAQTNLWVAFQEGDLWKSVPTQVGKSGATRVGTTNHFSVWNLFVQSSCQNGTCGQKACLATEAHCGGACVNLQTSVVHCGACEAACSSSQTCVGGVCKPVPLQCNSVQTNCGGSCVDLQADPAHCGSCNKACASGESCSSGLCKTLQTCPTGQQTCEGICVDVQFNAKHCGACGTSCKVGESCKAGVCSLVCPVGKSKCQGSCVDTSVDASHCGACNKACSSGESCASGQCQKPQTCSTGQQRCAGSCVDVQSDAKNCGTCGTVCKAGESCKAGVCQGVSSVTSCYGIMCNGKCVDFENDAQHCGQCNKACQSGELCCNGTCTVSDQNNCGGCGVKCLAHHTCQQGQCKRRPDYCSAGLSACDFRCVDLKSNATHCGSCGNKCPDGIACVNGACSGARYAKCGSKRCGYSEFCENGVCKFCGFSFDQSSLNQFCGVPTRNGCVDTTLTNEHCGGCGLQCPKGLVCFAKECQDPALLNKSVPIGPKCDGVVISQYMPDPKDPSNPTGPITHCAGCYQQCKPGYECQPGLGCMIHPKKDCKGEIVDVQTSPAHCGQCGQACKGTEHCEQGKCVPGSVRSNEPLQFCQGSWVDVTVDTLNCGACNNKCPNGQYCAHGLCQDCPGGQVRCNGKCIPVSRENCYACGSQNCKQCMPYRRMCACRSGQHCAGSCVDVRTSIEHCGVCNNKCSVGHVCISGICVKN